MRKKHWIINKVILFKLFRQFFFHFLVPQSTDQPWHATGELNVPNTVHPSVWLILYDSMSDEQSCRLNLPRFVFGVCDRLFGFFWNLLYSLIGNICSLDSSSSPTLTSESNSLLLISSSARENAPSPVNQDLFGVFTKIKNRFALRGRFRLGFQHFLIPASAEVLCCFWLVHTCGSCVCFLWLL